MRFEEKQKCVVVPRVELPHLSQNAREAGHGNFINFVTKGCAACPMDTRSKFSETAGRARKTPEHYDCASPTEHRLESALSIRKRFIELGKVPKAKDQLHRVIFYPHAYEFRGTIATLTERDEPSVMRPLVVAELLSFRQSRPLSCGCIEQH